MTAHPQGRRVHGGPAPGHAGGANTALAADGVGCDVDHVGRVSIRSAGTDTLEREAKALRKFLHLSGDRRRNFKVKRGFRK